MQLHLGSTSDGASSNNSVNEWDFAMASIQWIEDANHASASWQFNPTGGELVTGTAQNILAATAASTEGVNLGSWRGTITNDDFHWAVASTSGGYNMQLTYNGVQLNGANVMVINTEFDLDATAPSTLIQICDWESSVSVDNAADSQCTGGGWRTLNNRKVGITTTSPSTYTFFFYDGYWSDGSNTPISTPLTNFVKSTNESRIRLFSTTNTTSVVSIDYMTLSAVINPVYFPAGITNLGSGATTGDYSSVNNIYASDDTRVQVAGTAGSVADMYFSYKNIKTFTGMNTIYVRTELGCTSTGINIKPKIYNFNTSAWEDFAGYVVGCTTGDNTRIVVKNNITISDYLLNGEMRIGWYGTSNSTIGIRVDFSYIILGATNTNTSDCEISFGTVSSGTCAKTRDYDQYSPDSWDIATEDESNTFGHDYYALDNDGDAVVEEAAASHVGFSVDLPAYASMTNLYTAVAIKSGPSGGVVNITVKDFSGIIGNLGGFSNMGISGGTTGIGSFDNMQSASYLGSLTTNPEDYLDTVNNKIWLRLRTGTSGPTTNNAINQWEFAMVAPQWVETTQKYSHSAYRLYNNANSTDVGSVLAAQDTAATLATTGAAFRLRTLLHLNNDDLRLFEKSFKLQYVDKGGGSCASPSGGTPSSYTDVTAGTLIAYNDNASPADGAALTTNVNDPVHSTHKIRPQTYEELNNFTNTQKIIDSGQDGLWDFSLKDNSAPQGTTYCLRMVESDGTVLGSYSVYPEITTSSPSVTMSISDSTIGFGSLSPSFSRWATGDTLGSASEVVGHTIDTGTNAVSGYSVSVRGNTLTSRPAIQPNTVPGLLLWLKPESLYLNDNDPVSTWPDSSGNNNDATSSGSLRPLYKTNIVGGQPVARFDGGDDVLNLTSGLSTVRTVFIVQKPDATGGNYIPLLGHSTLYDFHGEQVSNSKYFSNIYTASNIKGGNSLDNGLYKNPDPGSFFSNTNVLEKDYNNFRVIEVHTTGNVSFDNISNDRGIAGRYFKGDIAELIVYDNVINTDDRLGLEVYLSVKYGLSFAQGPYTINPISLLANSQPGIEQFGIHVIAGGGSANVVNNYGNNFFGNKLYKYAGTETVADEIGSASTASSDTFSCYYLADISPTTEAGEYKTTFIYTITGQF